jgi:hypothetical protein
LVDNAPTTTNFSALKAYVNLTGHASHSNMMAHLQSQHTIQIKVEKINFISEKLLLTHEKTLNNIILHHVFLAYFPYLIRQGLVMVSSYLHVRTSALPPCNL